VSASSGRVVAEGRVRNDGNRPTSGTVRVTLRAADGAAVAVCEGTLNAVPPGAEVPYSAVCRDTPATWAKAEATIGSEFVP
jgi:hypothetical protein